MGAVGRYPRQNLIVVDFGTATTLCAVSAEGDYLGGIITPGVRTSMSARDARKARLPTVEICKLASVFGRSMVESIQSGLFYGTLATVRTLAGTITAEQFAGRPTLLVDTGGFGRLFQNEKLFDAFPPELPLLGLRRAVEMSAP